MNLTFKKNFKTAFYTESNFDQVSENFKERIEFRFRLSAMFKN